MNNEYKPILICNGSHKDFHDDGELICGGCGYVFSPYEAESLFRDCKLQLNDDGQIEVSSKPLRCIQCVRRYESIYFSELGDVCDIIPASLFKERYISKYGELILLEKFEAPLFIPAWDFNKQRRMAYADAVAYMLYCVGYTPDNMSMHFGTHSWDLYYFTDRISQDVHEDICMLGHDTLHQLSNGFIEILANLRSMKEDRFFITGGDSDD